MHLLDFLPNKQSKDQTYAQIKRKVLLQNVVMQIILSQRRRKLKPKLRTILKVLKNLGEDFNVSLSARRAFVENLLKNRLTKPTSEIRRQQNQRFSELNNNLNTFLAQYQFNGRKMDNLTRIVKLIHLNQNQHSIWMLLPKTSRGVKPK